MHFYGCNLPARPAGQTLRTPSERVGSVQIGAGRALLTEEIQTDDGDKSQNSKPGRPAHIMTAPDERFSVHSGGNRHPPAPAVCHKKGNIQDGYNLSWHVPPLPALLMTAVQAGQYERKNTDDHDTDCRSPVGSTQHPCPRQQNQNITRA